MFRWFSTYNEAYAYLCENGASWWPYGKQGLIYRNGCPASLEAGTGASKHLFLVGSQPKH